MRDVKKYDTMFTKNLMELHLMGSRDLEVYSRDLEAPLSSSNVGAYVLAAFKHKLFACREKGMQALCKGFRCRSVIPLRTVKEPVYYTIRTLWHSSSQARNPPCQDSLQNRREGGNKRRIGVKSHSQSSSGSTYRRWRSATRSSRARRKKNWWFGLFRHAITTLRMVWEHVHMYVYKIYY